MVKVEFYIGNFLKEICCWHNKEDQDEGGGGEPRTLVVDHNRYILFKYLPEQPKLLLYNGECIKKLKQMINLIERLGDF